MSSLHTTAVEVDGLTKRYGDHDALAGVTFTIPYGRTLAYLGRNGSGKSTTVRILCGLTRPTSGRVIVAGHDVLVDAAAVRASIGVTLQDAALDPEMTGREHVELIARAWGADRAAARTSATAQLEAFGLTEAADRVIGTYSGGMRRRLDLAGALLHEPRVLFLDEPSTGLDAQSRLAVWQRVRALRDAGTGVLLTTQYIEEAEQLADEVVILDAGRVAVAGNPDALKDQYGCRTLEEVFLEVTGAAISARQSEEMAA
jgi:ABC-2 type transport system ATP-binding protein